MSTRPTKGFRKLSVPYKILPGVAWPHNGRGNCFFNERRCGEGCADGELCDVCHEHDEPRGDCEECPPCEGCALRNESDKDRIGT